MEQSIAVKMALLVVAAAHAAAALDASPWWLAAQRRVCSAPAQLTCSPDCTQLLVCIGDGSGGYKQELVAACPSDTTCSADLAACVAPGSSECHPPLPADQFTCRTMGIFPDPYDCQKFHICTGENEVSVTGTCTGTMAYNPLKADCSLKPSDRVCTEGPIPTCTHLGEVGVVPENPAIFYVCKDKGGEMLPEINRCTANLIFDSTTASCVEPSTTSDPTQPACPSVPPTPPDPTTVTPAPSDPTTVTPTTMQSPPATTPPAGKCTTPAEVVADPADCTSYYQCIGGSWQHIDCIYGYHFDAQQEKCVYGTCPAR